MAFEQRGESLNTGSAVDTSRISKDSPTTPRATSIEAPRDGPGEEVRAKLDQVLHSDIGINTLLMRLKQSVSSTKEFSTFLRERATLEEKSAHSLQRLARSTLDSIRKPENRQGSFATSYEEVTRVHDRMADNGIEFAHALLAMAEELQELAANSEKGRKHWKHTGLDAEARTKEAETSMDKAKSRYYALAEQYDRVRTGERQSGKFGLKGTKSTAQLEEAILGKVDSADSEYSARVQAAQSSRHELITISRPQALRELQNLITESDAGLGMQMQKFAVLTEKLLLKNGLCVSPLKNQTGDSVRGPRSMRDAAHEVNNQRDVEDYIIGQQGNIGPTPAEIKYEKHPALATPTTQQPYNQAPPTSQPFMTPERRDTGTGVFNTPRTEPGQSSGVIPSQQGYPQGSYQTPTATHNTSNAPQLPQIGNLATSGSPGGRTSLDHSRTGVPTSDRREDEYRNFSGASQNRLPGQSSYSSPTGYPSTGHSQQQGPGMYGSSASPQGLTNYSPGGPGSMSQAFSGQSSVQQGFSGQGSPLSRQDPARYGAPATEVGRGQPALGQQLPGQSLPGQPSAAQQLAGQHLPGQSMSSYHPPGQSLTGQALPNQPSTATHLSGHDPLGQQLATAQHVPGQHQPGQQLPSQQLPGQSLSGQRLGGQPPATPQHSAGQHLPGQQLPGQSLPGQRLAGQPSQAQQLSGQDQVVNSPTAQNSYSSNDRNAPLRAGNQSGDIRNDSRVSPQAPAQGFGYQQAQPDGRGLPSQNGNNRLVGQPGGPGTTSNGNFSGGVPAGPVKAGMGRPNLPPLRPVFGVSLEELFRRDGEAVPAILYQCVQAVDLFGLNTDGIYRTSGSAPHIMELRALFDHDSSQVDFRTPAAFHNDIASVTTLLKHFLRDLPDPLLTSAQYNSFIQAAKISDDVVRRDSLHAIINSLPDPNYASLRTIILHLSRVARHSAQNRMPASNLAIVFGPTLMGGHGGPSGEIKDAGWQARVVETILANTFQIFDDDD